MRFLLVDAVVAMEPGRRARGVKNVTLSEDFLAEHFPHRPIMPGMLIVEALAQLGDWVVRCGSDFAVLGLPVAFDRVKFRRVVRPGDQLALEVEVADARSDETVVAGKARCGDVLVTSARITLAHRPLDDYLDAGEARRLLQLLVREDTPAAPVGQVDGVAR